MNAEAMTIAIVADFNPASRSHAATDDALEHSAQALGLDIHRQWIATADLDRADAVERLEGFRGIWIGPGSPYASMTGALAAIRFARENSVPLLGTCGGFQHIILEYARNVLGMADAEHEETSPNAECLVISQLACSLAGRTMSLTIQPDSKLARIYQRTNVEEEYLCNFGVNPQFVDALRDSELEIVASDPEGEVRAVELPRHPFFLGTLFLPQHRSTASAPHPVVTAFVEASTRHRATDSAGMKRLFSSPDAGKLGLIRSVLDEAGIEYEIKNETIPYPLTLFCPEIWVIEGARFDKACELRDAALKLPAPILATWKCHSCGEILEAQFDSCWNCGATRKPTAG